MIDGVSHIDSFLGRPPGARDQIASAGALWSCWEGSMADLPSGTVTFLLTDVEGSTSLWEAAPEAMRLALARHDALFDEAVRRHGGVHIRPRGEGDSRF